MPLGANPFENSEVRLRPPEQCLQDIRRVGKLPGRHDFRVRHVDAHAPGVVQAGIEPRTDEPETGLDTRCSVGGEQNAEGRRYLRPHLRPPQIHTVHDRRDVQRFEQGLPCGRHPVALLKK